MVKNQLNQIEKNLRYIAKRNKGISYSIGLVLAYLMLGINAFSQDVNTAAVSKQEIGKSADNLTEVLKEIRAENEKKLKGANLELVQLMEQGNQVVKSPWSSWQFGMNYIYESWGGSYKGRGDKKQKYPYEGVFTRSEDIFARSVSPNSKNYAKYIRETRDLELQRLEKLGIDPSKSATTSIRGEQSSYGLESSVLDQEPVATLSLLASVKPRDINKVAPTVNLGTIQGPGEITFNIEPPQVEITIPQIPSVSFNPVRPVKPGLLGVPSGNMKVSAYLNKNDGGAAVRPYPDLITLESTGTVALAGVTGVHANNPGEGLIDGVTASKNKANYALIGTSNGGENFKTYFEFIPTTAGQTATFATDIVIDSIDSSGTGFLKGGSRVGTLDNGSGTIKNEAEVNLAGPMVVGFVAETNSNGVAGERKLLNTGTITDAVESTHYQNEAGLGGLKVPVGGYYSDGSKNDNGGASATTTLTLPGYNEMGTITVTRTPGRGTYNPVTGKWTGRTGGGYVGYKIGLLLTKEDDDGANNYKLENTGNINFAGTNSIGIQIEADDAPNTKVNALNTGKISLGGGNSFGMKLSSRVADNADIIKNTGTITTGSGNSAGIAVIEETNRTGNNSIRAYQGKITNSGTINVNGTSSSGMYLKIKADDDLTNATGGTINVNGTSSSGMSVDLGTADTTAGTAPKVINKAAINVNGDNSIGMVANGAGTQANNNAGATISLNGGKVGRAGMYAASGASITNAGTITGNGSKTVGMVIDDASTGTNTGTINLSGSQLAGVYNENSFSMTAGSINISGTGAGVYATKGTSSTTLSGGNIKATNGGIALYAENGAVIELSNTATVTAGNRGLLFYSNPTNPTTHSGRFRLAGNVKGKVENGGIAFYLKEAYTLADITTSLNTMITKTNPTDTLTVDITGDNSSLFVIKNNSINTATDINLSEVSTPNNFLGPVTLGTVPAGYKILKITGAKLNIDAALGTDVNLDDANHVYQRVAFESSSVDINKNMTGTKANQVAVGQRNSIETANPSKVKIVNNAEVTLSGNNSTGLAVETGEIENKGTVLVNGERSTALYGADGSTVKNTATGTLNVGTKGAGILAQNNLQGTEVSGNINIINEGKIIANTGGEKVIGIHADNTRSKISTIDHKAGAEIDLTNATGSLGVFTTNSQLKVDGLIKVGSGSAGVEARNSKVDVTSGQVELGEKSIAFILKNFGPVAGNPGYFNGTGGSITLNGKDSVAYLFENANVKSGTMPAGNFVDNLTLTHNNNKYTYIYAKDSNLIYENTKTIDTDGSTFVNANNSSVELGAANNLTSAKANVVGVYLKNAVGKSAVNKGTIDFSGDKAVAMYGEGGGELANEKDITVFSNGVALYNKTGSTAVNKATGNIVLDGDYGIGMRSDNADLLASSINKGKIRSSKLRAVGMSASDGANSMLNDVGATIEFTGQQSIGMHTDSLGTAGHEIRNEGTIKLVSATDSTKPNIGIYSEHTKDRIINNSLIELGNQTLGIYSKGGGNINLGANSETKVGTNATAIFSTGGNIDIDNGAKLSVGPKPAKDQESVVLYYSGSNGTITNKTSDITIGDGSLGFVMKGGANNTLNSYNPSNGIVNVGKETVFIYDNSQSTVNNWTNLRSTGDDNYAIYTNGGGRNRGNIDFAQGKGNVAIYSYLHDPNYMNNINAKGEYIAKNVPATYTNDGVINVSASDLTNAFDQKFGIGMGAGYVKERIVINSQGKKEIKRDVLGLGNIENGANGIINVTTPNSIAMYAGGVGSKAVNRGKINLSGPELNVGMFLEDGAVGYNYGEINVGSTEGVGIALLRGSTLYNMPGSKINVTADDAYGIAYVGSAGPGSVIVNYGDFTLNPENTKYGDIINVTGNGSKAIAGVSANGDKEMGHKSDIANWNITRNDHVAIKIPEGSYDGVITRNGVEQTPLEVFSIKNRTRNEIPTSSIGIYLDTSGVNVTRPVTNLGSLTGIGIKSVDLIIGTEATNYTTEKNIKLSQEMIEPYNDMILEAQRKGLRKWEIYSGSLTWMATAAQNKGTQVIENAYLVKVPYTNWAGKANTPLEATDTYHFTDGLEQRYGVDKDGRERELFKKLNSIGNGEHILLVQAFDEMMGHQYANIQQRIHSTGRILDKEFDYLKDEWRTASKDSNKIKVFGMRGEYSTDTAGVIDYKNNAYGVAYVGENETIKLDKSSGWYTGLVHNKFSFKDIGNSKEEMLQAKLGLFKSTAFDDNGSLNWTISGEAFAGYNKMHRRFLVVDEIFNARSRYWSYGLALKNELSKTFRLSEDFSLRGYGSIKAEYGRFQKIKEKSGEVRLEIKSNDYISVRPEIGAELIYKTPLSGRNLFNTKLGVKYENELGKVGNAKNKARVAYTKADWFNIRGEKEDRRGSVGVDLSLGLDNERYGITASIGYDTKGKNKKAGLGLRVIF
ncbi:autotransporter-associated N-terminal domain-containing protein [Fusobacterium russii]|uniref:autotransporter-associated N-terminal domain-containing protein n=1 Tax=Fusobacterium russii TaxID=854 RepID=UPI0003999830|nr:autotransporter-associated N-terminal domain-containing protein [Fusobacterium russii]